MNNLLRIITFDALTFFVLNFSLDILYGIAGLHLQ